ncbi:MAG TPA: LysR family transcriptional regulator [Oxalicibacterium sp.]|uniref:LysR family transcriptional regulator n=1 Tax=Oxalicibacterium sp. TaxID=2766525 RepID=UPI002CC2CA54|nr:LysR family transcriptional regulator [Oxalicibacterium sp.]HWU97812.1 LysR family transcriptional regulator [Oxalicibacterium sp.]
MPIDEKITLKKLEVFLSFMQLGNLTRVADVLEQTPVSVHRALHSLEEGLHCPLFKREGRNLIPLGSAHAFAEHAARIINECEQGVKKVRDLSGLNTPQLRIGSLYSLTMRCIPQIFIGLKLRRPNLDIKLTLGSNRELLHSMADGTLDAIVVGLRHDNSDNDMVSVPIFHDDMFLVAPAGSAYAQLKEIDLAAMQSEKFVALDSGFVSSESFDHAFDVAGYTPEIATRVNDIFSLINLVSGGVGYALLPGRIAGFSTHIQLVPLSEKYTSKQIVTLLMPKNRERDPNLLALAAECRMFGREKMGMPASASSA